MGRFADGNEKVESVRKVYNFQEFPLLFLVTTLLSVSQIRSRYNLNINNSTTQTRLNPNNHNNAIH
jgi:hypothetical protein